MFWPQPTKRIVLEAGGCQCKVSDRATTLSGPVLNTADVKKPDNQVFSGQTTDGGLKARRIAAL